MTTKQFLQAGLLSLTLASAGLSHRAQAAPNPANGKAKFTATCVACHGPTGKGDGAAAASLNPKPRNLSDAKYMSTRKDADLFKIIKLGGQASGKSPTMPAWGGALKDPEITDVIAFIRTLCKCKGPAK